MVRFGELERMYKDFFFFRECGMTKKKMGQVAVEIIHSF